MADPIQDMMGLNSQLDAALQPILDAIATALECNAGKNAAGCNAITGVLRSAIKQNGRSLDAGVDAVAAVLPQGSHPQLQSAVATVPPAPTAPHGATVGAVSTTDAIPIGPGMTFVPAPAPAPIIAPPGSNLYTFYWACVNGAAQVRYCSPPGANCDAQMGPGWNVCCTDGPMTADQAAAYAVQLQRAFGAQWCPPPPGPPPPPLPPPPPPPPPAPPPVIPPPPPPPIPPPPRVPPPPTPITPPSPTPNPVPALQCDTTIPPIGSEEWCARIPALKDMARQLGHWALSVLGGTPGQAEGSWEPAWLTSLEATLQGMVGGRLPVPVSGTVIQDTINGLRNQLLPVVKAIKEAYCVVACADAELMWGLILCRALVQILRHLQIGWDIGIWAIGSIDLAWPQLEEVLTYLINHSCPYKIPSPQEAMDLHRKQFIDTALYNCWMLMNGCSPTTWAAPHGSGYERPGIGEAMNLYRRQLITGPEYQRMATQAGALQSAYERVLEAGYARPSIGEALDAFRRGWIAESEAIAIIHLNGGRAEDYRWTVDAQRERPGVGEREQFLYRLSATGEYTDNDFKADLVHDGYNERFQALAHNVRYRVIQIRQVQQLMDSGAISEERMDAALRAEGFSPEDLPLLHQMEMVHFTRRHSAEVQGYTPQKIAHQYARGYLAESDVIFWMQQLSYSQEDAHTLMRVAVAEARAEQARRYAMQAETRAVAQVEKAFKEGYANVTDATNLLLSQGALPDAANSLIQTWNAEAQLQRNLAAVQCVKRGWESGYLSTTQAVELVLFTGMEQLAAEQTVATWEACQNASEKVLSAGQVLAAMQQGFVSPADALARLTGQGYAVGEAEIMIAEISQKLHNAEIAERQKALMKEEADIRAAQKADVAAKHAAQVAASRAAAAAAKLAKEATAARAAAIAQLKKLEPEALMDALMKTGQISTQVYVERMLLYGYDQDSIALRIANVCNKSTAACVPDSGPLDDAALGSGEGGSGDDGNPPDDIPPVQ